jgi:pilus assembly protein CpaB
MRARTRAFMGLALALIGLLSAAFLFRSQARMQQHAAPEKPKVAIAVATRDIPAGTVVSDADVRIAQWPEDVAPPNHASVSTAVVGRAALAPIQKGEALLESRLSPTGAGAGLPVLIGPGYRALSVRVEDVVGIAGFVQPNSHVDVLVTARSNDEARSAVLLQGVRVLATGHQITASQDSGSQNSAVITLEVTPSQAEMLTLAASEGRIQLALRNPIDNASAATSGIRMNDLIPGYHATVSSSFAAPSRPTPVAKSDGPPREPRASRASSVEVFNGGTRAVTTFQDSVH